MVDWTAGRGWLEAGSRRLEWGAFGPAPKDAPDAPVIVLLHEGLGCVALWRAFPLALSRATGAPVFAYSRAGYGQSESCDLPRPLDYMTCEAVEVLPRVLDALGADRVILMGHSDGATIAAEYAGRVRDARVRGVILMAPHFFAEEEGLREIARAKEAFETGDLRARLAKYHGDVDAAFGGWNGAWLDPGFRGWCVADVLRDIRVPVLAIQGREDQYGTLAQVETVTRLAGERAEVLVLENCRHAPQVDQPEGVLKAVARFVTKCCAG